MYLDINTNATGLGVYHIINVRFFLYVTCGGLWLAKSF